MRLPDISIHALREEGDLGFGTERLLRLKISIHALREEGDYSCDGDGPQERISIHALREEGDADWPRCFPLVDDFYPRPPRGGRLLVGRCSTDLHRISIHALREEGDP